MALQGALRQIISDRKVAPYFLRTVRPWLGALAPEASSTIYSAASMSTARAVP